MNYAASYSSSVATICKGLCEGGIWRGSRFCLDLRKQFGQWELESGGDRGEPIQGWRIFAGFEQGQIVRDKPQRNASSSWDRPRACRRRLRTTPRGLLRLGWLSTVRTEYGFGANFGVAKYTSQPSILGDEYFTPTLAPPVHGLPSRLRQSS